MESTNGQKNVNSITKGECLWGKQQSCYHAWKVSLFIRTCSMHGLGLAENITYEVHWFLNRTLSCKTWRKLPIMSNNSVAIIYEISQTMNVAASLSFTKSILAIYYGTHTNHIMHI